MTKMTLDKLAILVKRGFDGVDKRFDGVDKRFDGVDKRFEKVDKRFMGIDKRFEKLEKKLNEHCEQSQQEHEMLNLRLGEFAYRFEVEDLKKRLEKVEAKLAIKA